MSIIQELKRRNVFRVLLTYAIVGWLLVEGMELLTGTFEAPSWVLKVFIGVLVLGALPLLIFSWVYEITPEGIRNEATNHPEHAPATGHKLDIAVVVMLTIAIGLFLEQRFSRDDPTASAPVDEVVVTREGPPMLAVLLLCQRDAGERVSFLRQAYTMTC